MDKKLSVYAAIHDLHRQAMISHPSLCTKLTPFFHHKNRRVLFWAVVGLATFIFSTLFSSTGLPSDSSTWHRRQIQNTEETQDQQALQKSWAQHHIKPLRATANTGEEVSLFWHIPKSGGTTVKKLYECMGQTLATAAGAGRIFIPDNNRIIVFNPYGTGNYVNVDTSNRDGLIRAKEMGLVESGKADLIFTTDVKFAVETLFDEEHPGRLFALFRHPIHRLVSKFYYMQTAKWERSYNSKLKELTLLEWATHINTDNNFFLTKLSGKKPSELRGKDLREAMKTLRRRFVVGLTDEMEESVRRFNRVMGIDEKSDKREKCMKLYFGDDAQKKMNAHSHPTVSACHSNGCTISCTNHFRPVVLPPQITEGSPEWDALYAKNELDVRLYNYVVELFMAQSEILNDFTKQYLLHLEKQVSKLLLSIEASSENED
ncbi:hypothetical protein ACHAW6_008472 [Cyclotella cf. meneghiniana]